MAKTNHRPALAPVQLTRGPTSVVGDLRSRNSLQDSAGSRTFALVIGIDKYRSPHKPRLQGAVNDARHMAWLLQEEFGVPKANVQLLCDQDATRKRIIAGFESLVTNPNIQYGDAIVIFFAGHGSQAPAPVNWDAEGGMVETLCPVDEEFQSGRSQIHGIPDRTVAGLVDALSKAKGKNIVSFHVPFLHLYSPELSLFRRLFLIVAIREE